MNTSYRLAITGSIAVGKTTLAKKIVTSAVKHGFKARHIDVDQIRAEMLESTTNPRYQKIQSAIVEIFGEEILNAQGSINRRRLAEIIYADEDLMTLYNTIFDPYLTAELTSTLTVISDLILLDWALITEKNLLHLTDYNVLLVGCSRRTQLTRLIGGDLASYQVRKRIRLQQPGEEKEFNIKRIQSATGKGDFYKYNSEEPSSSKSIEVLTLKILNSMEGVCIQSW